MLKGRERLRVMTSLASVALVLIVTLGAFAGEVQFAHLTDLHVLDDRGESPKRIGNYQLFEKAIEYINSSKDPAPEALAFVAVTGDLGINDYLKGKSDADADRLIKEGAQELGSRIEKSKVSIWLFVPGNNDLREESDGTTVTTYSAFIKELTADVKSANPGLSILDLCPNGQSKYYDASGIRFLGLDSSSFKEHDQVQPDRMSDLKKKVSAAAKLPVCIFTHIPDADNSLGSTKTAWNIEEPARQTWREQIANQPQVIGLFAGHFHSPNRKIYGWREFPSPDGRKPLFIAPPIARKKQPDPNAPARGFEVIKIDPGKPAFAGDIYWYNGSTGAFEREPLRSRAAAN